MNVRKRKRSIEEEEKEVAGGRGGVLGETRGVGWWVLCYTA